MTGITSLATGQFEGISPFQLIEISDQVQDNKQRVEWQDKKANDKIATLRLAKGKERSVQ